MTLLQTTLQACQGDSGPAGNTILRDLSKRLGDNNNRIREKVEEALLSMASHPSFEINQIVSICTRQQKGPQANSVKAIFGKMKLLTDILQKNPPSSSGINTQSALDFGLLGYKHQNGEIRNQAFHVIMECYKDLGQKVRSSFQGLRQAQIDMLEAGFAEMEGGSPKKGASPTNKGKR